MIADADLQGAARRAILLFGGDGFDGPAEAFLTKRCEKLLFENQANNYLSGNSPPGEGRRAVEQRVASITSRLTADFAAFVGVSMNVDVHFVRHQIGGLRIGMGRGAFERTGIWRNRNCYAGVLARLGWPWKWAGLLPHLLHCSESPQSIRHVYYASDTPDFFVLS